MELTLKQMILNELDKHKGEKGYSETAASIANYSSSALRKILNGDGKEFDKFNGLVNLVRFLFGENELRLMEQYSNEIDPCNKSARIMLEYLGVNRSLEVLKNLIDRMSECKNKDSREFAKVYTIAYEWQTNYYDLDTIKFINKINEVKTSIPELRVKLNLLKFYGFYRQQNYRMAFEIGKFIDIEA
jgi:hypothetical protein